MKWKLANPFADMPERSSPNVILTNARKAATNRINLQSNQFYRGFFFLSVLVGDFFLAVFFFDAAVFEAALDAFLVLAAGFFATLPLLTDDFLPVTFAAGFLGDFFAIFFDGFSTFSAFGFLAA